MSIVESFHKARIVIVGAGSAGIAAATRLLQSGFVNVLLLEAENRIGGRVHTVPFGDNVVDLGAQWCHGETNNPIFELMKSCHVLEATGPIYDDYTCVRSNGEILDSHTTNVLKKIAFKSIPDRQVGLVGYEGSLGAYLSEYFWNQLEDHPEIDRILAREFFENYKKFESSVEACDNLFEVSGKGHLDYWLCEGELLLNWRDKGFTHFLRFLMKSREAESSDLGILNQRVLFNRRVKQIDMCSSNNIIIRCWSGEIIEADHVICTFSLGVLQEYCKEMFTPALPLTKCRAINGLTLGTVDKFFFEFAESFWPSDWTGVGFLWREEDIIELEQSEYFWLESVFGFYTVSHQPRILEGWIIGVHARHMETLPERQVKEALLWLFRKFLTFAVPEPIRFLRTQWYTNPSFRGSYSFRSCYTDELRTGAWDLQAPIADASGKPILQFAGEATHPHFYSTVHGAVITGWREAQRLIDHYQVRRPAKL